MFSMSTIVPSPRIEAPLTNGEVTNSSSNALMTSSSSPISLSTASPNRLLPQLEHFMIVHAMNFLFADPRNLHHRRDRHGVQPPSYMKQQRLNTREGQRHDQPKSSPLASLGFNLDR